jgi:DNA-binding protein H-NS
MIRLDSLDALNDNDLREIIGHSETVLKQRDEERKARAIADVRALRAKAENDARTLLESVGLSLKSLTGKSKRKAGQVLYKGGRLYQHPDNKGLVWKANGQKPNWLRELEGSGGKAVEVEGGTDAPGKNPSRV